MDISNELLRETSQYIELYFEANNQPSKIFRNFPSTLKIVQTCDFISANTDLRKQDRMKILLAAWFLYTGAEHAARYFKEKGLAENLIREIEELIIATRYPQQPVTIEAQVICDATNSWLADKSFFATLKQLRKEEIPGYKKEVHEDDWLRARIQMLENHIYFIPFSRKMFDKEKEKNKTLLKEKLGAKDENKNDYSETATDAKNKEKAEQSLPDNLKLERGVETLFRNTARNQIQLIRLADYKASLILSINSIIISVVLSVLIIKLDTNRYLELPTLMLVLTNVITILIAISATRPRTKKYVQFLEQINDAGNNLLYYGIFYKMSFEEFNRLIQETIIDRSKLYVYLSRDIYHQGIILENKFKRINLSYTVFAIGLILSVLAYIFSFLVHEGTI